MFIENHFNYILSEYEINFLEKMKTKYFIFDDVDKKATINPQNNDEEYFQKKRSYFIDDLEQIKWHYLEVQFQDILGIFIV